MVWERREMQGKREEKRWREKWGGRGTLTSTVKRRSSGKAYCGSGCALMMATSFDTGSQGILRFLHSFDSNEERSVEL